MNIYRAALIDALKTLLAKVQADNAPYSAGICNYVGLRVYDELPSYALSMAPNPCGVFQQVWHRWEHYSGEPHYPLPGGAHFYFSDEQDCERKWQGQALVWRLSLIEFLIAELEKPEAENLDYSVED